MKSFSKSAALVAGLLMIASALGAAERRYVAPRTAADKTLPPFSGGVFVGDTFYLAGTIGRDKDGKVPGEAAAEAKLVLDDIRPR
jgi:enamine deaminase RidA (YjgF/YER057c/UK114 family)